MLNDKDSPFLGEKCMSVGKFKILLIEKKHVGVIFFVNKYIGVWTWFLGPKEYVILVGEFF